MKRKGSSLIELMVGIIVMGIVFGGVFTIVVSLNGAQSFAVRMPTVQQQAQDMALTVAAAIRRSTLCAAGDSGCTLNAGVEGTSAKGITVYRRDSGTLSKLTYSVNNGDFQRAVGDARPVTKYTGATLNLTYYQSSTYHAGYGSGLTPYVPTSSTTPSLVAVKVDATITDNGHTASYSTIVRLRNGPKKLNPTD